MILSRLTLLITAITLATANLLTPLAERVPNQDFDYKPYMDFAPNVCYSVTAVSARGVENKGLDPHVNYLRDCRSPYHLKHSNVYTRHICNHWWCANVYAYYFEMNENHKHVWEHVVLWVDVFSYTVKYVVLTEHGNHHTIYPGSQVRFHNTRWGPRALLVYFRDHNGHSRIRLATSKDKRAKNHSGKWFDSPAVGWNNWPNDWARARFVQHDWGHAHQQLSDQHIHALLSKSLPDEVRRDGFDCTKDNGWDDDTYNDPLDPV